MTLDRDPENLTLDLEIKDHGSIVSHCSLLMKHQEPWGGDTFHFVDFASSAHTLSRNLTIEQISR